MVTLKPGEALVSLRLLHATAMWSGSGPRKTLFYKYQPYGQSDSELQEAPYTIKYDLSSPHLTDSQRRILAWPSQWAEYNLGDYGPGLNRQQLRCSATAPATASLLEAAHCLLNCSPLLCVFCCTCSIMYWI